MEKRKRIPAEMRQVAKEITAWRAERVGMGPMPTDLWRSAVAFADEFGITPTSRWLAVDYGSLKKKCEQACDERLRAAAESKGKPAASDKSVAAADSVQFVELAGVQLSAPAASVETTVELSRPDGTAMTVRFPAGTPVDVAALIEGFLRRPR